MTDKHATKEETGLAKVDVPQAPATVDWSQAGTDIASTGRAALRPEDQEGEVYDRDEIKLPRLGIAQGLSPQLVAGQPEFIKGLSVGEMFNDVTQENYGSGPLTVVPFFDNTVRIEFDPNDRKVPLDRDVQKGDPRTKWTKDPVTGKGIPPAATEFVEMFCFVVQPGKQPEPVIVTIKTTNKHQSHAAKIWRTYIQQRGTRIYTGVYQLTTMIARGKNAEGQDTMYGHFVVKNAGHLDAKKGPVAAWLLEHARELHDSLTGQRLKVVSSTPGGEADDYEAQERAAIQGEANNPGM